jgi:outer membrane protein OmpA-like peptidoglycan-associated protein
MKKFSYLLGLTMVSLLLILPANQSQAVDMAGKWALSLHGGAYKLALTDHSDIWTVGWLANAELKYGVSSKWMIGAEGNFMQTYLADLTDEERVDGAAISTKNVEDGPRQRDYVAGLLAQCHFMPDAGWSPFVSVGTGMYIWNWTDKDMSNLVSWDPALATTHIPPDDKAGDYYHLKDQELYGMVGAGFEFFPSEVVSFELGGKFRYLTHLFTNFTDDKDIVGIGDGELDLPKAVIEVYAGLTFLFGGAAPVSLDCTATAVPKSGPSPFTTQFEGTASGGRLPYAYSWNFGDGSSSTEQNPDHTYKNPGTYTARFSVTDSKGRISQERITRITVACPPLTCTASIEPASGMVPFTAGFGASVTGGCPPYGYSWDFGEGGSSSEQNPAYRIEKEGSFTAQLTVTDSKGNACTKSVAYAAAIEFLPTAEKPLVLRGVNFATAKAVLIGDSKEILDRVAASLIEHPDVKVEVAGHCDSQGADAYNLKLSDQRANAVRNYLISDGVAADQLVAKGYGETRPIADNNTEEGRAENRRVELTRLY